MELHKSREVTWLDCTLRDGGYYNSWDFPRDVVQNYLYSMAECGANRVEIGFRSMEVETYRGFAAYTPDTVLESFDVPRSLDLGVMVNTKELAGTTSSEREAVSRLFPGKSRENLAFVRLATHLEEVQQAVSIARLLKAEGYEVALNLMQVSEFSRETLLKVAEAVDEDLIDVLYVADSLGNLDPEKTASIILTLRSSWSKAIGIHAHNNRGLALANSLSALNSGANWVDSTITGMGRGAGNTVSEILLGHLEDGQSPVRSTTKMIELIEDYFAPLQKVCRWGENTHYVRAAGKGIHPTFVQELLSNAAYSQLEIDAAIDALGTSGDARYSRERLSEVTSFLEGVESPKGEWNQAELFENRRILLIGSGETVSKHSHALRLLAAQDDIFVLVANLGPAVPFENIDAYIACHPLRIIADSTRYLALAKPLIAPSALLPTDEFQSLVEAELMLNLGLTVSPATKSFAEPGLIGLPKAQVLAYSLLACLSGGAAEVMLAGFDGYSAGDPRLAEEQRLLDEILGLYTQTKVSAITPTQYFLTKSSIYGILR